MVVTTLGCTCIGMETACKPVQHSILDVSTKLQQCINKPIHPVLQLFKQLKQQQQFQRQLTTMTTLTTTGAGSRWTRYLYKKFRQSEHIKQMPATTTTFRITSSSENLHKLTELFGTTVTRVYKGQKLFPSLKQQNQSNKQQFSRISQTAPKNFTKFPQKMETASS